VKSSGLEDKCSDAPESNIHLLDLIEIWHETEWFLPAEFALTSERAGSD